MRDKFKNALISNLQGMNQFARIMDSIPNFDSEDRKRILDFVFELEMQKTSMSDLSREEIDSILDEIFIPRFENQSKFVKYLFKTANLIQVKNLQAKIKN